jgi:misacylated tRNA(Ala) deacylase
MRRELVDEIEHAVNLEIAAERSVKIQTLPRVEAFQIPDLIRTKINLLPKGIQEVRTVEIVGLDLQADGGTHVANTKEVGRISILNYKSKGKINKRIYVALDDSA